MHRRPVTAVSAAIVALGFATSAFAQATTMQPRDPNMPAPHNTVPDKIEGKPADTTGSTGTLSDKLEATGGVIKPPEDAGVGRTIKPVDPGTTPVIPPAGEPGSSRPNAVPR